MQRKNLPHALLLGVSLVPFAFAASRTLVGCSEDTSAFTGPSGSTSSSGPGMGGMGGADTGGMGGMAGGASSSSTGMFVDDAGPKVCPTFPGAAEMVAVPGWNGGSYCIDKTEVTNAHYAAFLETSPNVDGQIALCASNIAFEPPRASPRRTTLPSAGSIGVTPTLLRREESASAAASAEALRLLRARRRDAGTNGTTPVRHGGAQAFPYGNAYDAPACNVAKDAAFGAILPVATLAACVGGYPGLFDMSGNVWEWEDSCVPSEGGTDVCRRRGGSFSSSAMNVDCAISSSRPRDAAEANTGFRCCAD